MAGANRIHWPRRGSLQFWPRVRARKQVPRVRTWAKTKDAKLIGFIGFKAGMTHVLFRDNRSTSHTKGMEVFTPVTIIECPPVKVIGYRAYQKTPYGLKLVYDSLSKKLSVPSAADQVTVIAQTNPQLTKLGKKHQDTIELGVGGANAL